MRFARETSVSCVKFSRRRATTNSRAGIPEDGGNRFGSEVLTHRRTRFIETYRLYPATCYSGGVKAAGYRRRGTRRTRPFSYTRSQDEGDVSGDERDGLVCCGGSFPWRRRRAE